VGERRFVFVDGGVTMFNNPAFQLFLMATVEPYGLSWPAGEKEMLIVSVGTGTSAEADGELDPGDMNLLYNASSVPAALMAAALHQQDTLCRVFGRCLEGDVIDREIKDLKVAGGPLAERLFTYVRYNVELDRPGLEALGLGRVRPQDVRRLDSADHIGDLQAIGREVGERKVRAEHFEGFAPAGK
jgi:hypothetical protein